MKIKTRESLRTIKTFDRAKTLGQKVKNGAGEIKEYRCICRQDESDRRCRDL